MYGDSSLAGLQVRLGDSTGGYLWFNTGSKGTIIDWNGWRKFEIELDSFEAGYPGIPVQEWGAITEIKLVLRDDSYGGMGQGTNISSTVYIDDIVVFNDSYPLAKQAGRPILEKSKAPLALNERLYNEPNPFRNMTFIHFTVKPKGKVYGRRVPVMVNLYSTDGEKLITLLDEPLLAGEYRVSWDGRDKSGRVLKNGIYFYQVMTDDKKLTGKMILAK